MQLAAEAVPHRDAAGVDAGVSHWPAPAPFGVAVAASLAAGVLAAL